MYKAGSLITLETGEYSDFSYDGPFRVLRDIDVQSVVTEFKKAKGYEAGEHELIAWLSAAGYIEDVDCARWSLGDAYGGGVNPDGYFATEEDKRRSEEVKAAKQAAIQALWKPRVRNTDGFSEATVWAEEAAKDKF